MVLSLVLLCACTQQQYKASDEVQAHLQLAFSKSENYISSFSASVVHDVVEIVAIHKGGTKVRERINFPMPNMYQGMYTINYSCDNSNCTLTYDEGSAEYLNDYLIKSLFDEYVVPVAKKLKHKHAMQNN